MTIRHRRRGVALLMTVVVLALVVVVTSRLTRRSYAMASDAIAAEQRLGWQWMRRTAETNLLPAAASWLEPTDAGDRPHRARLNLAWDLQSGELTAAARDDVVSGGTSGRIEVRIDDESGKLHPGGILAQDADELDRKLTRLFPDETIRLRPILTEDEDEVDLTRQWLTYDQIFMDAQINRLWGTDVKRAGLINRLTVFGDGTLHPRSIDPEDLYVALSPLVSRSDAEQLVRELKDDQDLTVAAAVARLSLPARQRARLSLALVDMPSSTSVWLRWRPAAGRQRLFVVAQSDGETMRTETVRRLAW